MDEGRKRVLLIAAAILAARRLAQTDAQPRTPAFEAALSNAIITARRILDRLDLEWPVKAPDRGPALH